MNTRLAGVKKICRGSQKLRKIYRKILLLLESLPEDAMYRQHTGAIICHRLQAVNEADDNDKKLEEDLCGGRIEMLVRQAEAEYELIQKMMSYKPWECLVQEPPPGQWKWPPS